MGHINVQEIYGLPLTAVVDFSVTSCVGVPQSAIYFSFLLSFFTQFPEK